jgi:hypothetical protein
MYKQHKESFDGYVSEVPEEDVSSNIDVDELELP